MCASITVGNISFGLFSIFFSILFTILFDNLLKIFVFKFSGIVFESSSCWRSICDLFVSLEERYPLGMESFMNLVLLDSDLKWNDSQLHKDCLVCGELHICEHLNDFTYFSSLISDLII